MTKKQVDSTVKILDTLLKKIDKLRKEAYFNYESGKLKQYQLDDIDRTRYHIQHAIHNIKLVKTEK